MPRSKLDRHYVSRAERKQIRQRERRFPALGSAIKTLLDIHSLDAIAHRDHRQRPYEWRVVGAGIHPDLHGNLKFCMPINAPLSDWQERCSRPDTWNGLTYMDIETYGPRREWPDPSDAWIKQWQQMQRDIQRLSGVSQHMAVHDEVICEADFSKLEARIAASLDQKSGIHAALTARLASQQGEPQSGNVE